MFSLDLCKYRWAFGKEGEGAHSVRLFDLAVVDVAATVVGGALISIGSGFTWARLVAATVSLFLLGIVAHRAFCVDTTINKAIFGSVNDDRLVSRERPGW